MAKTKFAVVTGASTGIGRAIAVKFGRAGFVTALVARRLENLKKTKSLVEKAGGQAEIFVTDLSNLKSVNKLISKIKKKTKWIDLVVNVAGVWHGENEAYAGKDYETFSQRIILDTFTVGLTAPALLAQAFARMIPKGGSIINISGTFESGAKGWLPYYVSKRAIEDLTVGLAEELKDHGIKVNCISPSDVATEEYKKYFPDYAKNALSPEEIANYALQLCSEKTKETGIIYVMRKGSKPEIRFHA